VVAERYSGVRVVSPLSAELGEGPYWHHATSELWWVDVQKHAFHRTDVVSGTTVTTTFAEPVSFVLPAGPDEMLVGLPHGIGVVRAGDGDDDLVVLASVPDDPDVLVNDAKFDANGELWFTTRSRSRRPVAALHRLRVGGVVDTLVTGLVIGNGMGWSPDGTRFHLVDTARGVVEVFDVDAHGGLHERRVFARVPTQGNLAIGGPDGMTVDRDGGVWVACFGASALRRYAPDGTLVEEVTVPVRAPTSCAFGGAALDQLFVTTAAMVVATADRPEHPFDGLLLALDVGVVGRPEPAAHPGLADIGRRH
jgi:sugar lactone lactonase YvrE